MSDVYDGFIYDQGGEYFNVKNSTWGAKGNTVMVPSGGSIAAGSSTFNWPGGTFDAVADKGKVITIQGAGTGNGVLSTTISAVRSATQVTLATPAVTGVPNAEFAYGTDDTLAIVHAITAAENASVRGTVYVPPGIYMIRGATNTQVWGGPVTLGQAASGPGGMIGCGGRPGSPNGSIFLCGDATAGLILNGWALYRGFMCDGNNIATVAIQNGVLGSGAGSYGTFVDVWSRRSAGNGWVIYTCQNNSYYSCGSLDSATDGLYIDSGAGGHDFWDFQEANSGRYGVHGDHLITGNGGYIDFTADNHFFGGTLSSTAGSRTGVSKVFLRDAADWRFLGTTILGDNLTGPTIDLTQNDVDGYGNDFSGCTISSTVTPGGASPGHACFQITQPPMFMNTFTLVRTDGVRFLRGDTSVYIANTGSYVYWARDWVLDGTVNGPVAASGLADIDTLLAGRTGRWVTVTPPALQAPWSGSAAYRINSDGTVSLKGAVTSPNGSGGTLFTLNPGYFATSGATMQFPAALSNGSLGYVTVSTSGTVAAGPPGAGSVTLSLDGISFPID